MNLAIYKNDESEFKNQGLGILKDLLDVKITENVQDTGNLRKEIVFQYPEKTRLSKYLKETNFIKSGSNVFEIYEVETSNQVITVTAQDYNYRYMRYPFDNGGIFEVTGTPQQILNYCLSFVSGLNGFTIYSDVKEVIYIKGEFENLGQLIDEILKQTKFEIKHSFKRMDLLKKAGSDSSFVLRDDKNLESIKIKYDFSEIINKIIPLIKKPKEDKNENDYMAGTPVIANDPFKFFKYWRGKTVKFDNISESANYFEINQVDKPKITVDVSPKMSQEDFDNINVFDIVTVYSSEYDFTKKLRVIKKEYNPLNNEALSCQLGDLINDFVSSQSKRVDETDKKIDETDKKIDESKKETSDALAEQERKAQEYNQKIQKDVDGARNQISNYLAQRNSDTITLIGSDGLPIPGLPPIKAIQSTSGMLINSVGFSWGGKVLGDNYGRFSAIDIFSNRLESTTINGGTINGGTIRGNVYIATNGGRYYNVMSPDNGLSVSDGAGNSIAIIADGIYKNGQKVI